MSTQKAKENFPVKNNAGTIKAEGNFTSLSPINNVTSAFSEAIDGRMVSYLTSPPFLNLDIANINNEAYRGQLVYYVESLSGISLLSQQPSLVTSHRSVFIMSTGQLANNIGGMYYFIGYPQKYSTSEPYFSAMPELNEVGEIIGEFTYSYGQTQFTINTNGLDLVTINNNVFASGGLFLRNASSQFNLNESTEPLNDTRSLSNIAALYNTIDGYITSKNLVRYYQGTTFTRAVLTHIYGGSASGITVYHEYKFNNDEIIIQSKVENNTSNKITVPSLGGLQLFFDRLPDGVYAIGESASVQKLGPINNQQKDYQLTEPGYIGNSKDHLITAAYAKDNTKAFSATPFKTGPHRQSIYLSDYQSGQVDSKTRKVFEYHKYIPVNPNSIQGTRLKLKFSDNTSWQNMLSTYKDEMTHTHGGIQYSQTDWRMILQATIDNGVDGFSSSNPYSFQENSRIDTSYGAATFKNNLISTYGSGLGTCIFWNLEGRNLADGEYRMEHDIWPPEVESTLNSTLIPYFSGNNISYGRLINVRNFNAKKHYDSILRHTFSGASQTQTVPMKLWHLNANIEASGTGLQLARTVDNIIDAGDYGTLRYTVTGVFPPGLNLALEYYTQNTWVTQSTITSPTINTSRALPTDDNGFIRAKYRFRATNWPSSGSIVCKLHTHQSSDNSFNILLSPKYTAFNGDINLQYKDIISGTWTNKHTYTGAVLTNSGQVVSFSGIPNQVLFMSYCTPSGWLGKLTIEQLISGVWTNGVDFRIRNEASTELTNGILTYTPPANESQYRVRSQNTWLGQANIIFGNVKSADSANMTVDIIPTDWRFVSASNFSGIAYTVMYEQSMADMLNFPLQTTRSVVKTDFNNQLENYKNRFTNVFNKGMTYFYGDTVGRYYDDYLMVKELRRLFPQKWQALNEYHFDYMMPYCGTYSTATLGNCPVGTKQTKTFTTNGNTYSAPYPVFISKVFVVSIDGTISSGNLTLQNQISGVWNNIKSYSGAITEQVDSNNSYINNWPWRLISSGGFVGNAVTSLYDSNKAGNYICEYGEDNIVHRHTITNSGQFNMTPLNYSSGTVVIHLNGSSWSGGVLHFQKYSGGTWTNIVSFSGIPTIPYKEYSINENACWRYLSSGNWVGTVYIDVGQWRSRCPGYFIDIMNYTLGPTENSVKLAADMPSTVAGSFYNWCYRNGHRPYVISSYESSGVAIQSQYVNSQGGRI